MIIKVDFMFECPFAGYELSGFESMGPDTVCGVDKTMDCDGENCPLKKNGEITVKWSVK